MLVLEWKERAYLGKVNFRCFCWFPAAMLVRQNGTPIYGVSILYKGAWNVSENNPETLRHNDLRLVFYNISFSWLLPLDGFQFTFFVAWQWKRSIRRLFWVTHVNRKWDLSHFDIPWHCQICLVKYLYSYRDDLPEIGQNHWRMQKANFWSASVAQNSLCLTSLIL